MKINYLCVLTIAGTDPSGGAGIQADIKTISATGCYAASVITALVAQNTQGVQAIKAVSPDFVAIQLESVLSDMNVAAIKIGMLHNKKIIDVIARTLVKIKVQKIVLDPVMVAKNGCRLLAAGITDYLQEKLFSSVYLITPNLFEAEKLLARSISNMQQMESAAYELSKKFQVNVLIKGGHLDGMQSSDVLYTKDDEINWFHAERIQTKNTHGTGCTLSSAIASYLAQDYSLLSAIQLSKTYLSKAIQAGRTLNIGRGCGPVEHFFENKL